MKDIKILIKSKFIPELSKNNDSLFYFSYKIKIQNNRLGKVQLLSRHWDIEDSLGRKKIVDGEGVVGEKPTILPGDFYEYQSFCPLKTEFGSMKGFFTMKDEKGNLFKANIPQFGLIDKNFIN